MQKGGHFMSEKDAKITADVAVGQEIPSDKDMEEFVAKMMARAMGLTGVKIDRGTFLRTELKKHCPEADADLAVATTPLEAGVSPSDIDSLALGVIDYETKKCAAISFLAGIPGGVTMAGTIPADLTQYFGHVMRVEQKLAYLYGWQSFLNAEDEVDDETVTWLIALMGIMLGVGGVASSITKYAATAAQQGVAKQIQKQALTKAFFYNPMKKVLRFIGFKMTKEVFAKGVSKVVPVVGGVISGGITYASFKPGAERLRRYLRSLPLSGIDESEYPDVAAIRADLRERERAEAFEQARETGVAALRSAGGAVASGAKVASAAVSDVAGSAGSAAAEAARAAGGALGSLLGRAKRGQAKDLPDAQANAGGLEAEKGPEQ